MKPLRPHASVSVPATSANLGPGFDCLGLALSVRDNYTVQIADRPGVTVHSEGRGAAELPRDETHLVASSLLTALEALGAPIPGLELTCHNRIPQGRGLGSSAAAIVGGVCLAFAVAADVESHRADILDLAAQIEGHPDNVAPAVLGGFTISWSEPDGRSFAVRLPVAQQLAPVIFIPDATSPTHEARAVLPAEVPFSAAVHNSTRSALLVGAVTQRPDLLFAATSDRLHQEQRRGAYPQAMALVDRLRGSGWPAVVSGAGPAVLVLGEQSRAAEVAALDEPGYRAVAVDVADGAATERPATRVADSRF